MRNRRCNGIIQQIKENYRREGSEYRFESFASIFSFGDAGLMMKAYVSR
jgi:hypothetical protein